MRVVMFSPSREDRGVRGLAEGLAARGARVRVLTHEPAPLARSGVEVLAVPEYPPLVAEDDELAWTLQFNLGAIERGMATLMREPVDVLHAFGWATAHAATTLRRRFEIPLVA